MTVNVFVKQKALVQKSQLFISNGMIPVPEEFHPEIGVGEYIFNEQLSTFLENKPTENKD